jgi:murein DD-endopeptidase MepM/ murein hydrolase activator NlpD
VIPVEFDTQGWNRFSYVRNNPVLYKDPTGHKWYNEITDQQADSGKFLKVDFEKPADKNPGLLDKLKNALGMSDNKQSLYTDDPAKDMENIKFDNTTKYKNIKGKGGYLAKSWENPADKLNRPVDGSSVSHGFYEVRGRNEDGSPVYHNGLDIVSKDGKTDGKSIKSMGAGRVTFVCDDPNNSGGKHVEISYGDGRVVRNLHMKNTNVKTGEWVNNRSEVGTVGDTGNSIGSHLHMNYKKLTSEVTTGTSVWNQGSYLHPNEILRNKYNDNTKPETK